MENITVRSYPNVGRYRLASNQTGSCTFFDAHDRFAAKNYAIGSIGTMISDQTGTLTDLQTGESWAIAVHIEAFDEIQRYDLNIAIREEMDRYNGTEYAFLEASEVSR